MKGSDQIVRMRGLSGTVARLLLWTLAWVPPASVVAQPCATVIWADEFSGNAVDESKWSFQIGDGCAEGICGWGNNELQTYQRENAAVGNGTLKITARRQTVGGRQYTSSRLRTLNKGDWTEGRFEARIKMTQGQGIWPAFWMLPTDEVYGGWPRSGEIDIMENIGNVPATVWGTIHFGDPSPGNRSSGATFTLADGLFADDFFVFAVERESGVIRWFVDDVLYSTKTPADTDPATWPFDERFHFLLNVAVGGDWPGSPDATTAFPQVLEVDYVRVYDGTRPHLTGDRKVAHREREVAYSVGNAPSGSSASWSVPAGAEITSGQGTSAITVNWGAESGAVVADLRSPCGRQELRMDVVVEPPFDRDFSFENFDSPARVTPSGHTGTLEEVANPDKSGVNTSNRSGRYVRDSGERYDVLVYDVAVLDDATPYLSGDRKFFLDVLTAAPAGAEILLQLEDSRLATPTNFPVGRHSRYQAFTTTQNQWERLPLDLLDRPHTGTSSSRIDTLVLLFAPDSFSGDTFFFDNFDSYARGAAESAPAAPSGLVATPLSSSAIGLSWRDNSNNEIDFEVEMRSDGSGYETALVAAADSTEATVTGLLPETVYTFRARARNEAGSSEYSNEASATTGGQGACSASETSLCLSNDRFQLEVTWRDFTSNDGPGFVVPFYTGDSGLFYFFDLDNWEMLVKMVNGCGLNAHFWIFAAATTNVEYTLRVTDTETGFVKEYSNPLGVSSPAITDTAAFATCP